MEAGDRVTLASDKSVQATVVKIPRSEGKKRPRAQIRTDGNVEMWVVQTDLLPLQKEG